MKKMNTLFNHRRMLLLLLILMTASTVTWAEVVRRTLVSQNYETAQTADWRGDAGASITLATGDAVNGTCVQIESTEGNSGVFLPIHLPDEVFYRDQYMSNRGYVVEFDFMIRSGNVEKVSQSQLIVQTQGTYPYHGGDLIEPEYYGLNEGGAPVSKWSSSIGASLSQPVRTESTYSTEWFMSYSNQGTSKVLESDKWYHFSAHPEYRESEQAGMSGFWFSYYIREKDTGTYIYGGAGRTEGLARFTGISALVGQGGMLKFDNLEVYDYSNYLPPTFELVALNGANRTYKITNPNEAASTLYYTHELKDEQPILGSPEYIRTTDKETTLTVTGTGNLYAYVGTDDSDYSPSLVTTQAVSGSTQTLMAPFHWPQGYDADANACDVYLESDQSWLDYVGDNMPVPTIMYAIDGGEYQPFVETITVPIGSQLSYYATLEGYNDSPVVAVTAGIPFWEMGMQDQWWADFGWGWNDKTPIRLGEEVEDGLFKLQAYSSVLTDHLLTPNENINDQFMIRNYSPDNGKVANSRRTSPKIEMRKAMPEKVIKKSRNLEEIYIQGIYSGDDRLYGVPDVVEGAYIMLEVQSVENMAVVTAVEGCEVDLWNSQRMPEMGMYVLKVTATGTAKFTVNSGTAIRYLSYYEPAPPQAPYFSYQSMDGANRTYNIYGNGATEIYYTTVPADEQPALDSDAWTVASGSSVQATFTGKGYIYAYAKNPYGTSDVTMLYVNGVALTMSTPYIYSKYYDSDTQLWSVNLYVSQVAIEGVYPNATIYYSIDGGEYTEYTEAFTIANGQQLSYYAKARDGFQPSPTVTCTAGPSIDELNLQSVTWESFYESPYVNLTLGEERTDVPGFCQIMNGTERVDATNDLLTTTDPIDGQLIINSDGLRNEKARTYAIPGLTHEHYLYIHNYNYNNYDLNVTAVENLEYDGWNSTRYQKIFKVLADGAVKFRLEGSSSQANTIKTIQTKRLPQWGYIETADANGNTLKYYYENAESDASFYGVTTYAADETKAGHIIIADKVTDFRGNEHNVTTVNGSLSNTSDLKSVVFGQYITSVGNYAFSGCSSLENVTLNSNLETLGSYTFQYCYNLASVNLQDTKVTAIPQRCFYCAGLTEINIPATITEIGSNAFYGCDSALVITVDCATIPESCFQLNYSNKSKLTTINIGKNVKSIGNYAFQNQMHVTAVNIDPEVSGLAIGNSVFSNCDALETIALPAGVTSIGEGIFYGCENLKTVIFDENSTIETIPYNCFAGCTSLETLTLPNSVKTVGTSVFSGCSSLRELTFGTGLEANAFPGSYYNYLFSNCSNLEKMTLPGVNFPFQQQYSGLPNSLTLFVNAGLVDTYKDSPYTNMYHIVPIGATTDFAIENEAGQLPLNLPDDKAPNAITLTVTGKINGTDVNWIHQSMPYLQELILTDAQIVEGGEEVKRWSVSNGTVTQNGSTTYKVVNNEVCDYMFNNMPALKHIALPASAKRIGKNALTSNAKLEQVDMGLALTAIDEYAFYQESKLTKADLPAGLLTIGQQAFYQTGITSVTIPDGVKRIENNTFSNCDQLKTATLPDGLEHIGQSAFYDCDNLLSVNIPKQVITIDQSAFNRCYKLASAIVIPAGCKTIGSSAFSSDSNIPSITFSEEPVGDRFVNLTASMWNQQWGCAYDLFTSSDMPFGHGSVPMDGFADLSEYDRLEVTVSEGAPRFCFNRQTANGQDTDDGVGSEMIDIPMKAWGTQKYQTVSGNVYTINLKQIVADQGHAYLHSIKGAYWQNVNVTSMRLYKENTETGVALTTIGGSAFSNCNKVEQVTLPESLTSLGSSAFSNCSSLKSFTFPANIKEVPSFVLSSCDNLESVTLATGTTRICSSAFYDCQKLATINLDGQPLTRIDDSAFGYTALTSVTLPNTLTTMGSGVFQNCTQLESANIPSQIKTVPSSTFSGCTSLTSVTLHDGITEIGYSAFQNCNLLPTLALNNQITTIGYQAFYGCEALQIEALPTSLTTIGSSAFQDTKAMSIALTIPESVTTIDYDAFNGSGITGLVMTKVPNSFGSEVFMNCKQLASVTLPADMTRIPSSTFYGTTALKTIDLPLGLTKIENYAFKYSGLETISLPQKLESIGTEAFYSTLLEEIRVPKNVTTVGSRFAGMNKKLKRAYLGRKQNYTNNSSFDYFVGCDNLELLRVYAGTPPTVSSSYSGLYYYNHDTEQEIYSRYTYYTGYRTNCVLEVPEGQVETYKGTNIWKDFKEIRVFESDDMLNDLDFAVLKDLYKYLNGASWTKPWDLTNQNHSIGKWQGITTEVDAEDDELFYITGIDLTGRGLVGPLPKSLFTLERLKTLNMSHNTIEAKVDTMITDENTVITELNMEGNHLKGDLYPFVSKLPNLTKLNVGYNWLTAYSQPTSNTKLTNGNMYRGYQFVDWATKAVNVPEELMDEVVIDFTPGTPIEIQSNTLQTYRHEAGDYNLSFSSMYRLYKSYDYLYTSDTEIVKGEGDRWDIYSGSLFKAPKGLVAYTHTMPYYSYITYILRIDWKDGDVNADQTVDVADLQNVVYYALNDSKPSGQVYNYTASDMNGDNKINVSDIVGTVGAIMNYNGDDDPSGARIYNKVETDARNTISTSLNSLLLANADEVAALQLTISGARSTQLQLSGDLKSRFTVSMRDVADGVRVIIYSPMGNTLTPGESLLLSGLPAGAAVTDARLVGAEANRLSVSYGNTTSIDELMADDLRMENTPIYDLSGRRVGKWNTLPHGIYIVNLNGKQFKVRK